MAPKTGTYGIADLLANNNTADTLDFGQVNAVLQADLAAHNAIMDDMIGELAMPTTERQLTSGTSDSGDLVEMDEHGRPPTQKPAGIVTVGIPLKLFGYALGWTRKWLEMNTAADLARGSLAAQKAHRKRVRADIQRAAFLSANYSFTDMLQTPNIALGVKRFQNADSSSIPEGPNGEIYDGATHQHYLANATLTAAAVLSAISTVVEHGYGGRVRVVIAAADETAFRALSGFTAYADPRLILATNANQANQRLDITRLDNRAIGIFGAAEVWVKPWGIANYALVYDTDGPKPLAYRSRRAGSGGLRIVAENDAYPLRAQFMEAEFGFGVLNRLNGAVLYFASGTYADPTIT